MNSQYLEIWLRRVKGLLYLHNPVFLFLGPEGNARKVHSRRHASCGCCVANVEVNATQHNASQQQAGTLTLQGWTQGGGAARQRVGGGAGGCCSNAGVEPVFLLIYLFLYLPFLTPHPHHIPKSSQAKGSRLVSFFFAWEGEEEQRGEVLPLIGWCGTYTQTEPLILLTNSFSGFPIRLTAWNFFFSLFWWLLLTPRLMEFGYHQKHWFIN